MKLRELIERLEEIEEGCGNLEVKGAFQPNYPLVARVDAVTTIVDDENKGFVYIALGEGRDYGSRSMWFDEIIDADEDADEDEEVED